MIKTEDYRDAPSGFGPLAAEWQDKPHRLIYDLCSHIEKIRKKLVYMVEFQYDGAIKQTLIFGSKDSAEKYIIDQIEGERDWVKVTDICWVKDNVYKYYIYKMEVL